MYNNENSNFQKMSTIKNNPNIEQGNASELNKIFNVKKIYIIYSQKNSLLKFTIKNHKKMATKFTKELFSL